jgi:hypothetical protein
LLVIIPCATATPLASVLIITLAWRQVLVKSSIIQQRRGRGMFSISTSNTTHKTVVVATIFLLYVVGGTLLSFGYRTLSSAIACLVFGISGVYLVINANKFTKATAGLVRMISEREPTSATGSQNNQESLQEVRLGLAAARAASRQAAGSMFLVFFFSLGYAVLSSAVGVPSRSDEIAVPGYCVAVVAVGNSLTALSAVRYARHARLIGEHNRGVGSAKIAPLENADFSATSTFG